MTPQHSCKDRIMRPHLTVQDGWVEEMRTIEGKVVWVRTARAKLADTHFTTGCHYTQYATDPACAGCEQERA